MSVVKQARESMKRAREETEELARELLDRWRALGDAVLVDEPEPPETDEEQEEDETPLAS